MRLSIGIVGKHSQDDFLVVTLSSPGSTYGPPQPERLWQCPALTVSLFLWSVFPCPRSLWCGEHFEVRMSFFFASLPLHSLACAVCLPETGAQQMVAGMNWNGIISIPPEIERGPRNGQKWLSDDIFARDSQGTRICIHEQPHDYFFFEKWK